MINWCLITVSFSPILYQALRLTCSFILCCVGDDRIGNTICDIFWDGRSSSYWFLFTSVYIYIYIYIFFKEKNKDRLFLDYRFISILFCVSDVNQKHEEKYNRASSDLMDKIKQNRHGVGKERKRGEELSPRLIKLPFFIYLFILFIFLILPSVGIMVI